MAQLFFQHSTDQYLFDTKALKLYRLKGNQAVEIDNPETMQKVRFNSVEISREKAFGIAGDCLPSAL